MPRSARKRAEKFLKKERLWRRVLPSAWPNVCARTASVAAARRRASRRRYSFDADKIDVCGATGIARTLLYQGHHGGALYAQSADGSLSDGTGEKGETFFGEYKRKLENIGERLFTARARELAAQRRSAALAFYYQSMLAEVHFSREEGSALLQKCLCDRG